MKLFILFSLILSPQGGIPGRDGNLALHSEIVYLLRYAYCILLRATLADTGGGGGARDAPTRVQILLFNAVFGKTIAKN